MESEFRKTNYSSEIHDKIWQGRLSAAFFVLSIPAILGKLPQMLLKNPQASRHFLKIEKERPKGQHLIQAEGRRRTRISQLLQSSVQSMFR
jgi:hypothetical protein